MDGFWLQSTFELYFYHYLGCYEVDYLSSQLYVIYC